MERVLKSQTFSRSDQLKRFLQYICEKDIAGKADEINEYSIAVEALGRPPDYSPAGDSSVRTRAHALRQKLQEYYDVEEPDAELRIDVPKGAYNPHFVTFTQPHIPQLVARTALLGQPPAPPRNGRKAFSAGVGTAILMGLLLGAALLLRRPFTESAHDDPALHEAWGPMMSSGMPVDVYIATPPAMLLHSYKEGQLPTRGLTLLTAPEPVASWYSGLQMLDGGGKLYMHTTQDVFLFGDALAATSAVQFLSSAGARPRIVPEANLRAFALRGRNVVLIGSPNYSPLAARFLMNTPFSVHFDPVKRLEVVSDGPPGQGAKRIFWPTRDELGMLTQAYGLITVLPSEAAGEGTAQTVIFSGITSAGPQAALEFFRSPDALHTLMAKLKQEGYSHFPLAYQVVVRCGLDHNLALNWAYETHQVIKGSPLLD
jgi:hypothetical protein